VDSRVFSLFFFSFIFTVAALAGDVTAVSADSTLLASLCQKTPLRSCTLQPVPTMIRNLVDECQREVAVCESEGFKPQRTCTEVTVCSPPPGLTEYAKVCAKNMGGAWLDTVKGLWADTPKELIARETYFKSCVSLSCKKNSLGPAIGLFSDLELQGHRQELKKLNLDPNICEQGHAAMLRYVPVEKVPYYCGASASALYRMIPQRLGPRDSYTDPWPGGVTHTGQELKNALSLRKLLDEVLKKQLGLAHEECYDPLTLAELRCYAVFTIVDPFLAAALSSKALKLVQLIGKASEDLRAAEKLQKLGAGVAGKKQFTTAKSALGPPKLFCSPGPCPPWLKDFELKPETLEHIGYHLTSTQIPEQALAEVQKKVQQDIAAHPDKPPGKRAIEKMLTENNTSQNEVFRNVVNTYYPNDFDVQSLAEKIREGKVHLEFKPDAATPDTAHYVATADVNGAKSQYNIFLCSHPSCTMTEEIGGVTRTRTVQQGDILTIFPECGSGVKTMLGVVKLAKSLRENPNAPVSDFIREKPCP
jgi:hypothetical protein